DFDVRVVPDVFIISGSIPIRPGAAGGRALVGRAEVDSTEDRYAAIRNEELAMVARVDAEMMFPRVERVEFDDLDSGPPQLFEEGGVGADGADAVIDDPDVKAGLALTHEQIAQHLPVATHVFKNVVFEIDVAFSGAN